MIKSYLKEADCFLLIYNRNYKESFNDIKFWFNTIKEIKETYNDNSKYIICLIANDFHLDEYEEHERGVKEEEMNYFVRKKIYFWEEK